MERSVKMEVVDMSIEVWDNYRKTWFQYSNRFKTQEEVNAFMKLRSNPRRNYRLLIRKTDGIKTFGEYSQIK